MRQSYLLAALLVAVAYLVIGFFPFYPVQPLWKIGSNGVSWRSDHELQFRNPGIAHTGQAPLWLSPAVASSSLHLSLGIRSRYKEQSRCKRIFTISSNSRERNLTICQRGSALIIKMRHVLSDKKGFPSYKVEDVFARSGWHQIELDIAEDTLTVSVDGNKVINTPVPHRNMSNWDTTYRLALGNEFTADRPWLGDIRKAVVTVDGEQYDYLSPGALQIPNELPAQFKSLRKYTLIPLVESEFGRKKLKDWGINFLGFVPFGWLIGMWRGPRRGVLFATLFSAGLSLTIEFGQLLFFIERKPSTEDLLLNICGGALGGWIAMNFKSVVEKWGQRA